jgi:hypothetical protein
VKLTIWHYAVDAQGGAHRVSQRIAEGILRDPQDPPPIPAEWHRDPNGLLLVGVLVAYDEDGARSVHGASYDPIAVGPVSDGAAAYYAPKDLKDVARDVITRARALPNDDAVDALSNFLVGVETKHPTHASAHLGRATNQMILASLASTVVKNPDWASFDLRQVTLVRNGVPFSPDGGVEVAETLPMAQHA